MYVVVEVSNQWLSVATCTYRNLFSWCWCLLWWIYLVHVHREYFMLNSYCWKFHCISFFVTDDPFHIKLICRIICVFNLHNSHEAIIEVSTWHKQLVLHVPFERHCAAKGNFCCSMAKLADFVQRLMSTLFRWATIITICSSFFVSPMSS